RTYSEYNYLRPGLVTRLKTQHFELALRFAEPYFHQYNAIDIGCADGPFLPSLAKYFRHVVGIDNNAGFLETAGVLCRKLALDNVQLICNAGLNIEAVGAQLDGREFNVMFLLETLEHIGTSQNMYGSKAEFLREMASLLAGDARIIISVPKMVGAGFLLQRLGLAALGMYRQPISFTDLMKATFLLNTDSLGEKWEGKHLGFNHRKLEHVLRRDFRILKKKHLMFQVMYVLMKQA
ncbi:MAG: methyltransferase domain-containing protein, partial [Planctomycetota bacterium]|nr:methyltransferase domain-containing protein [Planctomycetota bacterium]